MEIIKQIYHCYMIRMGINYLCNDAISNPGNQAIFVTDTCGSKKNK